MARLPSLQRAASTRSWAHRDDERERRRDDLRRELIASLGKAAADERAIKSACSWTPSVSVAAQPVASAEPPCHQWPEPGGAVVEGHRGKRYVVKCRLSILLAEDFQRDLVAE